MNVLDQVKVIDLFAGVGGLSFGAVKAGFHVALAVDSDEIAIDTHKRNFPNTAHCDDRVESIDRRRMLELAGIVRGETWGLIGGPPCQGFSVIGKRNVGDNRNALFHHFFRLVKECRPSFFIAENVPGILNDKYRDLRELALNQVPEDYKVLGPIRVCASDYGAPTNRTRVFYIGFDRNCTNVPSAALFKPKANAPAITVGEALKGLPRKIDPDTKGDGGWRKLLASYEGSFGQTISNEIPFGIGCATVIERYTTKQEVSGCVGTKHTPEVLKRFAEVKPGRYDDISNAPRLKLNGFCPTIRAGTGSDKGSYQSLRPLHPTEDRVITPREAARLQGFPDWFYFHPTKWHSFRQIGNSVSPIVAERILRKIARTLT
jgi:DNA (cytosine-5)-methyltransferase 1